MKSKAGFAHPLVLGVAALLLSACANRMAPAQHAIGEISDIVATTSTDGSKFVPDQMASVQKELVDLQSSYDKKDYAAVLSHAPAVLADAKELAAAAAAKKGEITKALDTEWRGFAASLPQWIAAVKDRVDALSKSKRVPKDIDFAAAKSGLADAMDGWGRAQAAMASGEVDNAIGTAKDVRSEIEAAAGALKFELPGADKRLLWIYESGPKRAVMARLPFGFGVTDRTLVGQIVKRCGILARGNCCAGAAALPPTVLIWGLAYG